MSRRQLSLVVVAIASLVVSACSSSPTGPRPTTTSSHDEIAAPCIGTTGSNGRC